ncbi:MAG: hypothetical protein JNN12_00440 [Bacteroidetes Order II. Incertae sedis bacterium]|nr:hypothetical protein [Bacteroidetes Order II. bacterium]
MTYSALRSPPCPTCLGIQDTPKHGSWLIEFSALPRQCLDRRLETIDMPEKEALAWQDQHNDEAIKISWSFTTESARSKLKNRYASAQKIQ